MFLSLPFFLQISLLSLGLLLLNPNEIFMELELANTDFWRLDRLDADIGAHRVIYSGCAEINLE